MKTVGLIFKLVILAVFLLLAVSNLQTVDFFYLPQQGINLPLIVVLFGAFVAGIVFGMFALFGRLLSLRSENARLREEVKKSARIHTTAPAAPAAPAAVQTAPPAEKEAPLSLKKE